MKELHSKILSKFLELKKEHKDFTFYTRNTNRSNSFISIEKGQAIR